MGSPGYIYIASTDVDPQILKIGKTAQNPYIRVQQLNSTGMVHPLILRKYYLVCDDHYSEKLIHHRLVNRRIRQNREFFAINIDEAKEIIETVLISNRLILDPNKNKSSIPKQLGTKRTVLLTTVFFGIFGVHHFIWGKRDVGLMYLFTLGFMGLGWFIDIVLILLNKSYLAIKSEQIGRLSTPLYSVSTKNIPDQTHNSTDFKSKPSVTSNGRDDLAPDQLAGEDHKLSDPSLSEPSNIVINPQVDHALEDHFYLEIPYKVPDLSVLRDEPIQSPIDINQELSLSMVKKLEEVMHGFGIKSRVVNIATGPMVTRYEVALDTVVKVSRIFNLADDIALNMAAISVRIEAPIPGKNEIGIEISNDNSTVVYLQPLIGTSEFQQAKSPLTVAFGRDFRGNPLICDLAQMPHLLITGVSGSGKSVCINSILISILFKATPDQVKMIMIDPKVVELSFYNGIPHLLHPVVTDPKKAAVTLQWAVNEMERRYRLFVEKSARDIASYNALLGIDPDEEEETLPQILLVIDELFDLMKASPKEVENAIARLSILARTAGIYLVIATSRPFVDVLPDSINVNLFSLITFKMSPLIRSKTNIYLNGAEKLLGNGDMLLLKQGESSPIRGHSALVTDDEVLRVITHLKSLHPVGFDLKVAEAIQASDNFKNQINQSKDNDESPNDKLLIQALQICTETGSASASLLMRRMTIGYPKATQIIDLMHERGYIGAFEGSKPRKLLINATQLNEIQIRDFNE